MLKTRSCAGAGDSAARAGMKRLSKWQPIESVVPDRELSADDAPIYASLNCIVTQIPEEQTLYYQANPANNKKVCPCAASLRIPQGPPTQCHPCDPLTFPLQVEKNDSGKYTEVGTGEMVDDMRRRYILNAQVMDFTNSTFVNIFNEQAEDMLGMRADELDTIKVALHLTRSLPSSNCSQQHIAISASCRCQVAGNGHFFALQPAKEQQSNSSWEQKGHT